MRAVGSQLVVEAIEDALRQGGLALFDEGFQLDSSLNWVFGETIEGEVDVVLPLWNGGRHVIFAQPGVVFWTGFEEEERIDGNIGAVYRAEIANGVIGGGSVFYDYDFQYGHSRIGGGIDLQSGIFQGALNYYHPLSDIEDGREGFIEEALRGMDLRVALEREAMRVSANLGYWRFEGDEDVKGDWKPSYGFDAGIRIVPGVFLEGGWERHDETVSLDERWNAGLAFRFSLPGFEGASYGDGGLSSNLWKLVEREKRILYEERLGIPRVNLTAMTARVVEPAATGGSETVTIMADLGKPLEEDVTLNIMVAETSTAEFGADKDFTYGYKVYELDAATGEQSAPAGDATECMEETCAVPIPAGVTRFDIEAEILMTAEREIPEFIDFQIEVPEEHAGLLRGGSVARVAIEAHGNEIGFAADATTTLAEDNETTGVEVSVSIDRPSPTPITLNVATSGTATEGEDYWISTRSLTIPANASSASLTLRGINNERGEGSKSIVLTISGSLPEGWEIADGEHTVTLQDDDLSIFISSDTPSSMAEPADGDGDVTRMITVGITQAPTADITVSLSADTTASIAASGDDFAFAATNVTFTPRGELTMTRNIMIADDSTPEGAETIVLTLADDTLINSSREREGSGFSLGGPYTITIPANDNTVSFASDSATTLAEDNITTGVAVRVEVVEPAPVSITLNVTPSGMATEGTDYSISPRSLTIPANTRMSAPLTLRGIDNMRSEGNKQIVLTFTGNLPDGWDFASDPFTHTINLQDDDLSVGFERSSFTIDEPGTDTDHTVDIEITQEPADDITLQITRASASTADTTGSDIDVTFSPPTVTFTSSDFGPKTVTLNVKADTIPEGAEFIELELGDSGNTRMSNGNMFSFGRQTYRLNINASDNVVEFASSTSTLGEQDTANVEVSVGSNLPSPITLNIATGGNARETRDYMISSPSNKRLVIPAGESSGTITLAGVDDDVNPPTAETIELTISVNGSLPPGWTLGSQTTHTVTLRDDDSVVGFASDGATVNETDSDTTHTVNVVISNVPTSDVMLNIASLTASTADTLGSEVDVEFNPNTITFPAHNSTLERAVTFTIKGDTRKEDAEYVTLRLQDNNGSLSNGLNAFDFGHQDYRLDIRASDNTISIDSSMSDDTVNEDGGSANPAEVVVSVDRVSPDPITLNVLAATSSTALSGDYNITGDNYANGVLTIPAMESSGTLKIEAVDDETEETTSLTIDLEFTGNNLPTGWALDPSSPLTHTVTILDDEAATIGWVGDAEITHNPPAAGATNQITLMVRISKSPSSQIDLNTTYAGATFGFGAGSDFFTSGGSTGAGCTRLAFSSSTTTLTQSCTLTFRPSAAGKTMTLTLAASTPSQLTADNFSVTPSVLTIKINEAPELGFAETTDTVDAPTTANRIHDVTIGINRDTSSAIPFIVEVTGGTKASVGVGGDWSYASQRGCDEASFAANGGRTVTCRLVIFPTAKGKTLTLTIKEAASSTAIADAGFTINPAVQMLTVN